MSDLKSLLRDWPALSPRLDEALDFDPSARSAWLEALPEPPAFRQALRDLLAEADTGPLSSIDAPRLYLEPDDDGAM